MRRWPGSLPCTDNRRYYHTLGALEYAKHSLFKWVPDFGPSWKVPQVMHGLFNEPWIAADGSQIEIG